jgi:hypothetical protein
VGGFTLLSTTDMATAKELDNLTEFQQSFAATLSRFAESLSCFAESLSRFAESLSRFAETCFCLNLLLLKLAFAENYFC